MTKMQRRESFKLSTQQFIANLFQRAMPSVDTRKCRPINFEPLELRQLMAADFYDAASMAAAASLQSPPVPAYVNSTSMNTSGLVGEGEDAPNLVEFAKALTQSGAQFFGADWCPHCNDQKKLFEDGAQYLPFREMTNADAGHTRNAAAIANNVTEYPTWQFANGTRVTGVQTLQQLSALSGVAIPTGSTPTFVEIPTTTVMQGSPMHVPVDAYDPNGGPLTITVTSSNPSVITAEMVNNNKSWKVSVDGYGDMVFRLFADEAARPVGRIEALTNSGFYNETSTNKISFHRVIDNFVLQAGDPTATGSGGSTLGNFDDQFNLNLQHNRTGILSYAKSSDDTNDSQFFITEGPQRHLDFNHSIFGQLIEGESAREGISRVPVNSSNKPVNDIIINSASIFNDTENGLIRLKALQTSGSSTITVTVADAEGHTFTRTFVANAAANTYVNNLGVVTPTNGAPFLNDITVPPIAPGQTVSIQLSSQDDNGQPVVYSASKKTAGDYQVSVNPTTGLLSVTAPTNFTGSFQVNVSVAASDLTTVSTGDKADGEALTFNVSAAIAPTAVDLVAASDTGISDSDNITNAATMQFTVTGTTAGATVNLKIGDQIVGTAVATGATTTISTTLVSQLGSGSRNIVATQTLSGQTSSASPALTVVYDSTPPAAINSSLLPTNANVGNLLSVDLANSEEGQGLRYSLTNAPAGLTINATTGVMTWTPISSQLGPQTANLVLTDAAGNSQTQALAINVADQAKVGVSLQLFDSTNTNALASASVGQEFVLRIVLNDLRTDVNPDGEGVFSAYMDLLYDSDKLDLVGSAPLTYSSLFGNGKATPDISVPGIVNELGAFSSFNVGPGRDPQLLATVRFRVKTAGQALFSTNPAENASRGFSIFKEDTKVPDALVNFGTTTLPIGQNFVAVADTYNFDEDTSNNSLSVLDNDTIVPGSGAVLTVKSLSTPNQGGTVSISTDNKKILYTPRANFNGQETFTYTVQDQTGATATATATVQVRAVNDNPVAVNDTFTTIKSNDVDFFLNVLANDTLGPDTGETLTVTQVGTTSQGGTVKLASAGSGVLYTPKAGFTGNDTFTYTISDGNGGTATATATVTVSPAVPPPTVVGESFTVTEDAAGAEFNVLSNDTPANSGDTLSISDAKAPNGTVSVTSNGTKITYAPKANFNGRELVVYTVRGSNGGLANATATFTVTAVNDAPTAVNDSFNVLSQPSQSVDVLNNDTNVDTGETYTITAVTQPTTGNGTVQIGSNGKTILYTAPSTDFKGTVTFTYTISDGSSLTSTATVTLNVQNYTLRDVGVILPSEFSGLPLSVELVPGTGVGANNSLALIPTDSGFKVSNVGPGEYKFSLPDLPFLTGGAQSVVVESSLLATSSLSTPITVGTREARYIDIRDFMGQNLRRGLTTAVSSAADSLWTKGQGDWTNYSNIKVSLNTAGNQLTLKATDPTNKNVQATLPVSDPKVVLRGIEGNSRLYQIQAAPSDLTLTQVTSTASTTSSSSSNNSGASGEGEGSAAPPVSTEKQSVTLDPKAVDQVIQQVKTPQRVIASGNQSSSGNSSQTNNLLDAKSNSTPNSNPISNGFRRGFRTR